MAERMPPVAWTRREDLAALVEALGLGNARWVGGAVRDALLGEEAANVAGVQHRPQRSVGPRHRLQGLVEGAAPCVVGEAEIADHVFADRQGEALAGRRRRDDLNPRAVGQHGRQQRCSRLTP